ncbi:hypothetical protein TRIUR3_06984 [Triticum urartu]|uniref:Uncharacterized protein n=1 Tax=Triticum urartu TaxID=4572 RepID=M7ZX29_TRIUA|nr:hypothetical protein TRIUR3_06984 [Triticum urartu]
MDYQVGLLDIDICGPSIPKMLDIHQSNVGWSPVYVESNLGVMSIGFMLPNPDDAVIWRGPRKNGLVRAYEELPTRINSSGMGINNKSTCSFL